MKPLPHPENLHFDAAQGWLMLGDVVSARAELAHLSASARNEPDVLEFEWGLLARGQAWGEAARLGERLVERAPKRAFGWIHRAYAIRRMEGGGLQAAWDALRPAHDLFPKQFLIPYNLACYAAQLGRLDDAWEWLQRALACAGKPADVRAMALADPDLQPLWPRLKESR